MKGLKGCLLCLMIAAALLMPPLAMGSGKKDVPGLVIEEVTDELVTIDDEAIPLGLPDTPGLPLSPVMPSVAIVLGVVQTAMTVGSKRRVDSLRRKLAEQHEGAA